MYGWLLLCMLCLVGCSVTDPDTFQEPSEATPVLPPVPVYDNPSSCESDVTTCLRGEFWRVFQRDFEDRPSVHATMGERLSEVGPDLSADDYADLVFKRAQLGMALILENGRLEVLTTVVPDLEKALELKPADPFYQIWLDTMLIALAQINGHDTRVAELLQDAWNHVESSTEHTTRSTLVASLTGTTVGLSRNTNAPQQTLTVIESFACHPNVLAEKPDQMCGRGEHRRPCIEWCLQPSLISPYTGPGLLFHQAETYARLGYIDEARDLLTRTLQAPSADVWPFRGIVVNALSDVEKFSRTLNPDDPERAVFLDVYANSQNACVFCHASPEADFSSVYE